MGLVFIGLAANVVLYFSEIILILVMAWVFAFVLSPVVTATKRILPAVPRSLVVVTVYALLFVALSAIVLVIASQLADSIVSFTEELPTLRERMPEILGEWQDRLDALGLQVNLVLVANDALDGVAESSGQFLGPLQEIALASLNTLGNLMFMVFLSLFIVIDKDRLLGFVNQVTPPRFAEEMRLFQTSVASSFGGFIRGQGIQGLVFGAVAAAGSIALGIDFVPLTTALVAIFQMIPFFGPFVSWAPPVVAAILTQPDAIIPIIVDHGRGLVRDHEHRAAASHGQQRGHPPHRGAGLRPHRPAPAGRRGRHLRHPRGGRHLGLLLPLPEPFEGRTARRHQPRRPAPGGAAGAARAGAQRHPR